MTTCRSASCGDPARPLEDAFWEKGMFANQNSACTLRQEFTLAELADHFDVDGD